MNYQKKPPKEVLAILKERNVQFMDISYYAWPQLFSSTAGPCGGIGGQAMSTFTIEAWVCENSGPTVFTCAGMYHYDDERFEPFKRINSWMRIPILDKPVIYKE